MQPQGVGEDDPPWLQEPLVSAQGETPIPPHPAGHPIGMFSPRTVSTPHLPRSWMASSNLFSSIAFCTSFVLQGERCSTVTPTLAGKGAGPSPSRLACLTAPATHHLDTLHERQPHRLVA